MVDFFATSAISGETEYVHSPVGLFPVPLGPSTRFSVVEEICSKFRFLGKLMAKAIMDSRMVNIVNQLKNLHRNPRRLGIIYFRKIVIFIAGDLYHIITNNH